MPKGLKWAENLFPAGSNAVMAFRRERERVEKNEENASAGRRDKLEDGVLLNLNRITFELTFTIHFKRPFT